VPPSDSSAGDAAGRLGVLLALSGGSWMATSPGLAMPADGVTAPNSGVPV
jgi:hypothetical protein